MFQAVVVDQNSDGMVYAEYTVHEGTRAECVAALAAFVSSVCYVVDAMGERV